MAGNPNNHHRNDPSSNPTFPLPLETQIRTEILNTHKIQYSKTITCKTT